MKLLFLIALNLLPSVTTAKTIKIAVVDTGFDFKSTWQVQGDVFPTKPTLCPIGHKDFTGEGLNDTHGHGTHVAGLIGLYAGKSDYCLVILKYYSKDKDNLLTSLLALKEAITQAVDIINYSGGGVVRSEAECLLVKQALDKGIKVIVAAGNESSNLDKNPYYPAMCDNRITIVENIDSNGKRSPSSNYSTGDIPTVKELGTHIFSIIPNGNYGFLTGTSQATAIVTGKTVKKLYNLQNLDNLYIPKLLKFKKRMLASYMQCK